MNAFRAAPSRFDWANVAIELTIEMMQPKTHNKKKKEKISEIKNLGYPVR